MTRGRRHFCLLMPLIAVVTLTDCDQSKATSPGTAAPDAALRFANAPDAPSQVRGFDFIVSQVLPFPNQDPFLDPPFVESCMDISSGSGESAVLIIGGCSHHWASTDNSDGTNLILDYRAMCVDGSTPHGQLPPPDHSGTPAVHPVPVAKCTLDAMRTSRFRIAASGLTAGLIIDDKNGMCLSTRWPVDQTVFLADCDESQPAQLWFVGPATGWTPHI